MPGFTIIEVMVVLLILALLAGLVGPRTFASLEKANVRAAEVQVRNLRSALEAFRLEIGRFPTTSEGLGSLVILRGGDDELSLRWQGPYLDGEVPVDPWSNPYRYESPVDAHHGFILYSTGPDRAEGGGDDIGHLRSLGVSPK